MDPIRSDLRYALRSLQKSPGFTLVAVLTLALGIGANTAIFSVVDAVLLKPLPYPDPDQLFAFTTTTPQGSFPAASPTKFNVWRQVEAFRDVSAYRFNVVNLTSTDPEQIAAGAVSAGFFRLFGAPVAIGRTFTADEDRPNGGHVVVMSRGFWRRRFGGDPAIVGRTIPINNEPYVVIGVLGEFDTDAIRSPDGAPDVWLPFQIDPESTMQGHYFTVVGRPRVGVSPAMITAQLRQAAAAFREKFPTALAAQGGFGTKPLQEVVVGNIRTSLWVLLDAVAFVLLIACANVANLLLVRATVRQREIAIRAAIGASRAQITREVLIESVCLSLAGGALGLAVGLAGIRALVAVNPGVVPRIGASGAAITADWRVLTFTVVLSVLTGIVFGLYPAFRSARTDLTGTLKEGGGRSGTSFRRNKVRAALVVTEVALALVLLVGAALLIRTFAALRAVDPGFDAHHVLTLRMSLAGGRFTKTADVARLIREGTERLEALPGAEVASASCCVPLEGGFGLPFTIVGRPLQDGPFHGGGSITPIAPGYFSAFHVPVLRGRAFTERDDAAAPPAVIINEAMAKRYWPNGDPLADQIVIAKGGGILEQPPRQIVGVVGNVRDIGLNRDPQPIMYIPWPQAGDGQTANMMELVPLAWIVRTRAEPHALTKAIEGELRQASGGLPVARVRTMDEVLVRSTARADFNMLLLTVFACAALLLAAIGIYGLMAYVVEQRTQEIGVRMAVGATAERVRSMVIGQGMLIALVGVAVGLASAFGLTRVIAALLFGVTARDPLVFASVPVLLVLVALVGVWIPARRAARVDPLVALRAE